MSLQSSHIRPRGSGQRNNVILYFPKFCHSISQACKELLNVVVMLPGLVVQVIQLLKIILQCSDVPPQPIVVAHKVDLLVEKVCNILHQMGCVCR